MQQRFNTHASKKKSVLGVTAIALESHTLDAVCAPLPTNILIWSAPGVWSLALTKAVFPDD